MQPQDLDIGDDPLLQLGPHNPVPLGQELGLDLNIADPEPQMDVDQAQADFPNEMGEIDLNVEPMEVVIENAEPEVHIADNSSDSDDDDDEVDEEIEAEPAIDLNEHPEQQILLALPSANPNEFNHLQQEAVNFLPLEIQEDDLMSENDSSGNSAANNVDEGNHSTMHQLAEPDNQGGQDGNTSINPVSESAGDQSAQDENFEYIHVGMVRLVQDFDHDLVLESFTGFGVNEVSWTPSQNADGVRLWAKYFAPVGHSTCFEIP